MSKNEGNVGTVIINASDEAKSTDLLDLVRKAKLRDSLSKGYASKGKARGGVCGHTECRAEYAWITSRKRGSDAVSMVMIEEAKAFMLAKSVDDKGQFACFFTDSNPDIH